MPLDAIGVPSSPNKTNLWMAFFDSLKGNYLSPHIPEATISWPDDDDDDYYYYYYDFALIPQVFDRTPLGTVLSTYDHHRSPAETAGDTHEEINLLAKRHLKTVIPLKPTKIHHVKQRAP